MKIIPKIKVIKESFQEKLYILENEFVLIDSLTSFDINFLHTQLSIDSHHPFLFKVNEFFSIIFLSFFDYSLLLLFHMFLINF